MFSQIPLFQLAERRLAWTGERQKLLAQNIANLDTPHWTGRDVAPFAASLRGASLRGMGGGADVALARTDGGHLAPRHTASTASGAKAGERAPDGNGVSLDDQLTRIAENDAAHELTADLYRKYLGMFRTALGR
ncbi:MAG: flagellar biosynthesis protein FlgB [Alphaproteobacteria bacterium]|nr:flagellar biosynthesis protein FlgB [Alphaproteobacteria bacterium]